MAKEFSWSRLRQAMADIWMPAEGAKDVIPKILAGLALLGFTVGAYLKPEVLLPATVAGRVVLSLLFFFALSWNVQVAYSLRRRIDRMRDAAKAHAMLPPAQRERVHRIKELAGRIRAGIGVVEHKAGRTCVGLGNFDPESFLSWLTNLSLEAGAVLEHRQITFMTTLFLAQIQDRFAALFKAEEGDRPAILGTLRRDLEQPYQDLIRACNDLLEEYPPQAD